MAKLTVVNPYYFQHQYLSVIAKDISIWDGELLENPFILNTYSPPRNGFRSPFSDEDIAVDVIINEGQKVYVWRFPESPYLREALYIAFFPVDTCYKAYAICVGQLVDWEISTSEANYRSCHGQVKKPESAEECVDLLSKRGAFTGTITPGCFVMKGYKSPQYRNN